MRAREPGIESISAEPRDRLIQILNTRVLHHGMGQETDAVPHPIDGSILRRGGEIGLSWSRQLFSFQNRARVQPLSRGLISGQ